MSNPRLTELMNQVDLREVISEATEVKIERKAEEPSFTPEVQDGHFHEAPTIEQPVQAPTSPLPVPAAVKPEVTYTREDAEKNARSLVYGLQSLDSLILTPIAAFKTKSSIGGKEVLDKMKAAYIKKMSGEKLNETEEAQIKALDDYERKMTLLSHDFIPTPAETEKSIQAAIPYCEDTQLIVKSGLAFWGHYAGNTIGKITKILMK